LGKTLESTLIFSNWVLTNPVAVRNATIKGLSRTSDGGVGIAFGGRVDGREMFLAMTIEEARDLRDRLTVALRKRKVST